MDWIAFAPWLEVCGWRIERQPSTITPLLQRITLILRRSSWKNHAPWRRNWRDVGVMHHAILYPVQNAFDMFERPVLKFGSTLVQLPWIVGMQNNSTAAINNLRRLGSWRGKVQEETQRIEASLASALESRGFRVLLNWQPSREGAFDDPGEVDVIATRDGHPRTR